MYPPRPAYLDEISGEWRVPLGPKKLDYALVDQRLAEAISRSLWVKGDNDGYAKRGHNYGDQRMMHRYVMHLEGIEIPDGMVIDHINHNKLDNRRANLRVVTHAQNHANSAAVRSAIGIRGVCFDESENHYEASHGGKRKRFLNVQDAVAWRNRLGLETHGECFLPSSIPEGFVCRRCPPIVREPWNGILKNTDTMSGVTTHEHKYQAFLYVDGRKRCLGRYDTWEEARIVHLNAMSDLEAGTLVLEDTPFKLDADRVMDIRRQHRSGIKPKVLAADFKVSLSLVYAILKGQKWGHLPWGAALDVEQQKSE